MSFERAKEYLCSRGFGDRILTFAVSSATVELAAAALGTEPARIAKSLTFCREEGAIMVVCAGDRKVNSGRFRKQFGIKARMLNREQVHDRIGHDVGGVCPFGICEGTEVWLDVSLRRFDTVYPACGDASSAVALTPEELELLSGARGWADVCVPIEENNP